MAVFFVWRQQLWEAEYWLQGVVLWGDGIAVFLVWRQQLEEAED